MLGTLSGAARRPTATWSCHAPLRHPSRLPPHEVHQDELPQRHRIREVRLPPADGAHFLHELDQTPVAGEHEGIDQDSRATRSEEHTSELQSLAYLVCRLLLEKKKKR